MKAFLKELAETIYSKHESRFEQLTLVFPNRRAGLFFRKYLAESLKQPIWSPEIISLEDFVQQLSPIQLLDKLALVFKLHKVYCKHLNQDESFERFFYWGDMLIKDFDDIDKYLVDAKSLFTNIQHQKELDDRFDFLTDEQRSIILRFWKNFYAHPSDEKEDFMKVWKILFHVYDDFRKLLYTDNQGYMGFIFRDVVDKIQNQLLDVQHEYVIFAGFNALTNAEEKIISWYLENGRAEIYWDIDNYYIENKDQEAGEFFRQYKSKQIFADSFPNPVPQFLNQIEGKTMQMTGVPLSVGQAKIMGQDLAKSLKGQDDYNKTVVVLPEENLLFPVLHALPDDVNKINVTMGFPLKNTPLYSLFEHLLEMQINLRQSKGEVYFPHRQVLSILKHPLIRQYDFELAQKNIQEIERYNKILIHASSLQVDDQLYPLIFDPLNDGNEIFNYLMNIMMRLNVKYQDDEIADDTDGNNIEKEYSFQFYTQLNRLKEVTIEQGIELPLPAFLKLFRQLVQSLRMPFTGEPLQGLQIMGVLETRNLDFENVYILSMNEGAFPANPRQHSFIPYNIRKAYELPNYDHQDAIYAYLFYRIIQRAKNVHFYYNTESGLNQGGEMSRYLLQLGYESHFDIKKFVLNNPVDLPLSQPIVIEKNEDVLKMMDKFKVDSVSFSRRLTPSAINTYLDCKLKFYLRYVAGIKEPDKMEDEIDPRIFGNLLHNTMELLYKDLVEHKGSMEITADDLTDLNEKLNKVVEKAFKLQYDISEDKDFAFEGRNVLAKSMVIKFASKIIENDRKYAPFNIIGLEADEDYFLDLNINTSDKKSVIGLKGIIDRIDLKDSIVRVIDYKTGKDDKGFENIEQLFDADDAKRNKAAMQTILYCLLYASAGNNSEKVIMPGIFNSREMFDNDFDFRLGIKTPRKSELAYINDIRSILVPFQTALSSLLEQMFSTDQPFDQTEDLKKCELCPYAQICHR